jgi:hypothetical protein
MPRGLKQQLNAAAAVFFQFLVAFAAKEADLPRRVALSRVKGRKPGNPKL